MKTMMTNYHVSDAPIDGSTGQDCGIIPYHALPERLRAAIDADPDAGVWTVPALSGGDVGDELDDLIVTIERCSDE